MSRRRIAALGFGMLGAGLLGWAAALQLDDPDPVLWIAIYGGAALVCLVVSLVPRAWAVAAVPAAAAAIWSATLFAGLERWASWDELTTRQPMTGGPVEESREALGLALTALWCLIVLVLGWRAARAAGEQRAREVLLRRASARR